MANANVDTLRAVTITQTLATSHDGNWHTQLDVVTTLQAPQEAKYIVRQVGDGDFLRIRQFEDLDVAVAAYNVAQQEAKDKQVKHLLKLVLANGYVPEGSVLHNRIVSALN